MATTLYWIIDLSAGWSDPTAANIVAGQKAGGSAAIASGSEPYTAGGTYTEQTPPTSLSAGTAYKVAWVAYDGSTYGSVVVSAATSTLSTHLITLANSSQANTASAGAIKQTHLISGANSQQSNVASAGGISQTTITYVAGSDSTQANQASTGAVVQTHLVAIANSGNAIQASAGAIRQTHLISGANSNQANQASAGSVSQDSTTFISAANSVQANTASVGSIQQTHLIVAAPVAVDNIASTSAIVQTHLVGGANSVQGNVASAVALSIPGESPTLNQADIDAIAAAVWAHASGAAVATRLAEAWGRLGLDPSKPLVTGQTEISFGAIVMALTGDANETTVTRQ